MWTVVENSGKNGIVYVSAAPKKWIENDILYWPNALVVNRKNPADIQKGVWLEFKFTILKDNIATYEEALAKEKFYSEHRNTESENEKLTQKQLKRKHPVNSKFSGAEIDVNELFDSESDSKIAEATIKKANPKKNPTRVCGEKKLKKMKKDQMTAPNLTSKKQTNFKKSSDNMNRTSASTSAAGSSSTFVRPSTSFIETTGNRTSASSLVPSTSASTSSHQFGQPLQRVMPAIQSISSQEVLQQQTDVADGDLFAEIFSSDDSNNFFSLSATDHSLDTSNNTDRNSHNVYQSLYLPLPQQTDSNDLSRKIGNDVGSMLEELLKEMRSLKQFLHEERNRRQQMEARLQANLDFINQKISNKSNPFVPIDDKDMEKQFNLPITDSDTVRHFEKFLRAEQYADFKQNLVMKLSRIGGPSHPAKLRSVASRIIVDEALQHFTWKGTNTKESFIQFSLINSVIKDAITTDKEPYTDHDHNVCMKEYCKHATTRLKSKSKGSRKHRKKASRKVVQKDVETISESEGNDDDYVSSVEEDEEESNDN